MLFVREVDCLPILDVRRHQLESKLAVVRDQQGLGHNRASTAVRDTSYLGNKGTESTGCSVEMVRVWPLGCIAALSVRAYRKKTLTPLGVATAIVVSSLYSIHPWGVFLVMLLSFYLTSTFFTKV